jgi:aminopeptidase N
LGYLMSLELPEVEILAEQQYQSARNMTDRFAALSLLTHINLPLREEVLSDFYGRFKDDNLVLDKWFSVQAMSTRPNTLDEIKSLTMHQAFDIKNPNKVRALLGAFAKSNPSIFHAVDGSGYDYLANRVLEIDKFNPQVAARLVEPLTHFARFALPYGELMKGQLESLLKNELSRDVFEIVSKSLQ